VVFILDKSYDSKKIEEKWRKLWAESRIHSFDPSKPGKVYSFDTPPPFTSGTLHMGHIYNHTWIDIVARYKRMQGFNVYLPQGFDCHGLPTELRVEKDFKVKKENRDEFLKKCREWTESAVARMKTQFDSIGYSTDWDYTYKTMDDSYKAMVQKTLLQFYDKHMLFREKHPVLWCPRCETALAKAETGYVETEGKLYHIDLEYSTGKCQSFQTKQSRKNLEPEWFISAHSGTSRILPGRRNTNCLLLKQLMVVVV
jgi:valyl-tRNA synthetase